MIQKNSTSSSVPNAEALGEPPKVDAKASASPKDAKEAGTTKIMKTSRLRRNQRTAKAKEKPGACAGSGLLFSRVSLS